MKFAEGLLNCWNLHGNLLLFPEYGRTQDAASAAYPGTSVLHRTRTDAHGCM